MTQSRPREFWDSSAIISAVFGSRPQSEARQILQLGDLGFVDMRCCRDVVRDVQFACAVEYDADIFATTDKQHFIGNPLIGPPHTRCQVMTPHEVLDRVQEALRRRSREVG